MDTVKMTVTYKEPCNRVELIVRFIWGAICGIVLCIIGAIAMYICFPIQWIYMLVLGKRLQVLDGLIRKFVIGMSKLMAYYMLLTDERPPIMPED